MATTNEDSEIRAAGAVQSDDDDEPRFYLTVGAAMTEAQRVLDILRDAFDWQVTDELDAERQGDNEVVVRARLCGGLVQVGVIVWQGSERIVELHLNVDGVEVLRERGDR